MAKAKKAHTIGPIRQNLEAFGVAILAAVLLKWFCIEAYQIPTSSMQPTLMGSSEASVYDRILVDKLIQTFREPQRWDITVFKYPLQKNQNYVKRIVGMPNDRLFIAGGNVYQVSDADGKRTLTALRKPDDLQDVMWKNLYPGRQLARSETKALGQIFSPSPSSAVTETDTGFTVKTSGTPVRLRFRDAVDGGMVDRVWDGYPAEVARAIREQVAHDRPQEIVPDARLTALVTSDHAPELFAMEIEVARPELDTWIYALVIEGGKGSLQVRDKNKQVLGESPQFAVPLTQGSATELSFAHVDDQLIAWQDGSELQRFDTAEWACTEGCVIPFDPKVRKFQVPSNQYVIPQFVCKGKGTIKLDDVRVDRDQHYTRDIAPEVIEVPDGHYYMMGDNTLQSIDSRGWTAVTIGVDENDNVVPPDTLGARVVRGNKRAMPLENPPDRDETPIAIPSENKIVMIDEFGEILRLNAEIGPDWPSRISFMHRVGPEGNSNSGTDGRDEWIAPDSTNSRGINFVPRSDIQGRALMVFYPARPISWLMGSSWPNRFGLVR